VPVARVVDDHVQRYFAGKDDVLARQLADTGQEIAEAVAARPATERPWVAVRRGFDVMLARVDDDGRSVAMMRALLDSAALQTHHTDKHVDWQRRLAAALDDRLPERASDARETGAEPGGASLAAESLASAALACLNASLAAWVAVDGSASLAHYLDVAMGAVHPLGDPS
jgi:AcrR family transcriptional regulator